MSGLDAPSPADVERELELLLEAIYQRFHHDFRSYSKASLQRRVNAAVATLGCKTIAGLRENILRDPLMFTAVLRCLTVQVSDLYRDPSYFRVFRERIVPELQTYPSMKLWVAGCSTGEELYSFAILLHEEGLLERTLIYATDINPEALATAEAGVYPLDRMAAFSDSHARSGGRRSLSSYYTAGYGAAVFDRSLRSNVVFTDHSLATDHVFSEVQVVSCRNVLIYFDRTLQSRAVGLFRDSLCRRGFLGLGSKEGLQPKESDAFQEYDRRDRWYRRL